MKINADTASKYFSPENLMLAWERMVRSSNREVKDYFGIEILAYDLENNLQQLSEILSKGEYEPARPQKFYEPKASRTHRTKTILRVQDALVYQAIANIIAQENYDRLSGYEHCVFGSVLHPEVKLGTAVLDEVKPELFFYSYYLPLYQKFANSVNKEIEDQDIQFKLETDITGFFDCIPHSALLMTLYKYGVEEDILNLLDTCLNVWSGTRDAVIPGVGIPQGPPPSSFFANLFLHELDVYLCDKGYTYYRYMDDIRIYEEEKEKAYEALVRIDKILKSKGLSLNTKKTSVRKIQDRDKEKISFEQFIDYDDEGVESILEEEMGFDNEVEAIDLSGFSQQEHESDHQKRFYVRSMSPEELAEHIEKEIQEVQERLLELFHGNSKLSNPFAQELELKAELNDNIVRELGNLGYRYRSAFQSVRYASTKHQIEPEKALLPIWFYLLENIFWKANQFAWIIEMYGPDEDNKRKLFDLIEKFGDYEWVQFHLISCLALSQKFTPSELKDIYRSIDKDAPYLVKLGYYKLLLYHLEEDKQLFKTVSRAIQNEPDIYLKKTLMNDINRLNQTGLHKLIDLFGV